MNEELLWYAEVHTTPESPILAKLNRETHMSQVYPRMLAGHVQGTFLKVISQMIRPSRVLEIGTFTGYSAICFAEGAEKVHSIEVDPELEEMIRKYLKEAGVEERVVLHIGDALEIIPTLEEQWDLVYIDADKPNYLHYYQLVFDRVRPGGFILADNTLWGGKVLEKNPRNKDVIGIREFNDFVQQDERVENLLLPLRDGIMLVRKK
ncbi:MAG: O-methyltransferase [Bacteroidota bacterium]